MNRAELIDKICPFENMERCHEDCGINCTTCQAELNKLLDEYDKTILNRKETTHMKLEVVVQFENGFGMKIQTNLEGLKRWLPLFEQSVSPISRLEVITLD